MEILHLLTIQPSKSLRLLRYALTEIRSYGDTKLSANKFPYFQDEQSALSQLNLEKNPVLEIYEMDIEELGSFQFFIK